MDDTQLDALLNRLRQEEPPAVLIEPAAVWRGASRARHAAARRRGVLRLVTGIAAAALLGVVIGRESRSAAVHPEVPVTETAATTPGTPEELQLQALAETSVTLFTAVVQREPVVNDSAWTASVTAMLWAARRLLSTPGIGAARQALLQDLELVLVQLLGAAGATASFEMELAREAIEMRDIVSRLGAVHIVAAPGTSRIGEAT